MKKQWRLLSPNPQAVDLLRRQIGCSLLTAQLLVLRGIETPSQAARFLSPSFSHLTSPLDIAGMPQAVERIGRALTSDEKILVFGDYDADGITATALLVAFLRQCGAQVNYLIPHRIIDGYGMDADLVIKRALPTGTSLVITVDCGSADHVAVEQARRSGIDTIVTDHHSTTRFPDTAVAVINPTRVDCEAGLDHLAGVGVAFYLIIALRTHLREIGFWNTRREPNLKALCDLVAVGTVADVAPLILENRALTAAGIQQLNQRSRPGLAALMRMSGLTETPIDAEAIAFKLAPRLNAAGRLAHARMACELLLTSDTQKAARLAGALCRLNDRRQSMETQLLASIVDRLDRDGDATTRSAIIVYGDGWHEGILGIVAARLTRRFHRPAVVISSRNGIAKGSARSIEGIDIAAALGQCKDLLDRYGGHPQAAGLSLPPSNLEPFKSHLETVVAQMAPDHATQATVSIDAHLPLGKVTPALMTTLERLGPFGQGNPHPLFMDTGIHVVQSRIVGDRHRKMVLKGDSGHTGQWQAIQFNVVDDQATVERFEKIAYRPAWNYWNGKKRLQLVVEETAPQV